MRRIYVPRRMPLSPLALCPPQERTMLSPLTKANWFGQPGTRFLGQGQKEQDSEWLFLFVVFQQQWERAHQRMASVSWVTWFPFFGCCRGVSFRCPWELVVSQSATQTTGMNEQGLHSIESTCWSVFLFTSFPNCSLGIFLQYMGQSRGGDVAWWFLLQLGYTVHLPLLLASCSWCSCVGSYILTTLAAFM